MRIRMLIVDDHKILREGVHFLPEKHPDMEVDGEAYNDGCELHLSRGSR